MAVKKKTLEQIAKENKIDLSDANAQKVADAYIQPTLNALVTAEQNAVASTQSARKTLESDYFKQYRDTMYDAQSRGLTGGLANIDTNRLRMQLGEANSDLSNALLQKQAEIETDRGTALSNARAYKEQYLKDLRDTVIKLREDDYAQRLAEYQFEQQMAMQRAQLAASYYRSPEEVEAARLQNDYNKMQIIAERYPEIAKTYMTYINKGDAQGAYDYLSRQGLDKYGYSTSALAKDLSRDIMAINSYNNYNTKISEYTKAVNAARAKVGAGYVGSTAGTLASAFITPWAPIATASVSGAATQQYKNELTRYQNLLAQAEKGKAGISLPSWYTP